MSKRSEPCALVAQDPAYRLFLRATTPILLNAVLYGPSAGLGDGF